MIFNTRPELSLGFQPGSSLLHKATEFLPHSILLGLLSAVPFLLVVAAEVVATLAFALRGEEVANALVRLGGALSTTCLRNPLPENNFVEDENVHLEQLLPDLITFLNIQIVSKTPLWFLKLNFDTENNFILSSA